MDKTRHINSAIYHSDEVSGEQYTNEIMFSYQLAGKLTTVEDGIKSDFPAGSFRLVRRNRLIQYLKSAGNGRKYQTLSVVLHQPLLRSFATSFGYKKRFGLKASAAVIRLQESPLYNCLIDSMLVLSGMNEQDNHALIQAKLREVLLILLTEQPDLEGILFDFSEPVKNDIAAFMKQNFTHNLSLSRFAYLSGRSLSGFKRDFYNAFSTAPGRWLLEQRLEAAKSALVSRRQKPSEVYLKFGFEDLAHFSRAFKNRFGIPPSKLSRHNSEKK